MEWWRPGRCFMYPFAHFSWKRNPCDHAHIQPLLPAGGAGWSGLTTRLWSMDSFWLAHLKSVFLVFCGAYDRMDTGKVHFFMALRRYLWARSPNLSWAFSPGTVSISECSCHCPRSKDIYIEFINNVCQLAFWSRGIVSLSTKAKRSRGENLWGVSTESHEELFLLTVHEPDSPPYWWNSRWGQSSWCICQVLAKVGLVPSRVQSYFMGPDRCAKEAVETGASTQINPIWGRTVCYCFFVSAQGVPH